MLGGSYTRRGNTEGELAGKIVFYSKANKDTDYSYLQPTPHIRVNKGTKLFAKAFFAMTLGRVPHRREQSVG